MCFRFALLNQIFNFTMQREWMRAREACDKPIRIYCDSLWPWHHRI